MARFASKKESSAECVPSRQRKQLQINHNNKRENMQRNNHQYKIGDKIRDNRRKSSKHELEFMGPFPITQINDNGTVRFQKRNHQRCHQYSQNKTIV